MKRFLLLPAAGALLAAAAPQPLVEVANGDWSQLPPLQQRSNDHLFSNGMARVFQIASQRKCAIPGLSYRRLDLKLSFAVQYNPDGSLARVVLPRLNCPEVESILGGTLLGMLKGGDYRPTGENPDGWYRGQLAYGYEAEQQLAI